MSLVQEVSPYATTAVATYGGAVLARADKKAADATVEWGRALLQRIFGVTPEGEEVLEAMAELAAQMRALLEQADAAAGRTVTTTVTASGKGAVAAGRDITGSVTTGDQSPITPA
ncbi:hypothetical protein [Streptosporangium sp. CA-115845]|uniref:hypothetical protein n=1 Tax=Streptosporangium sp. CA-115845 TaxID=3240071 RepID=UPI003D8FEC16